MILKTFLKVLFALIRDNTEKIWACRVLAKPKMIEAVGLGGDLSPPGGPEQCLGERV